MFPLSTSIFPAFTRISSLACRPLLRNVASRSSIESHRLVPVLMKERYATAALEAFAAESMPGLEHTRNIGIIAHIDAGKTTTTERMLYYSGFTRHIGDVDEGSTVMDYLPAERARGITITSACITFPWHDYIINLIDTPGHADFTFEVERSIRILDGAVTILDGVAGVEAQTEIVWRQAARYGIPRIVFVNKLDRTGAAFGRTVKEVGVKLGGWPAVCQIPLYEMKEQNEEVFEGVIDIVEQRVFRWPSPGTTDGRKVSVHDYEWLKENHPEGYAEAQKARIALVELLSEFDEILVETFLKIGDHHQIPAIDIKKALRRHVLGGKGSIIPIFGGASFRNVGVQPLLDAVIDYLPSPLDCPPLEVSYKGEEQAVLETSDDRLCALAFKVVHDPKRGPMVFVRVYSGTLTRSSVLYNTNLQTREKAQRLLRMYANDAVDIQSIPSGHIGVILGLKHARTGDTLITETKPSHTSHYHHGKSKNPKNKDAAKQKHRDLNTLQLRPIFVPPPVFFASIEPTSLSEQKHLEEALAILLREDPSLHVNVDGDSGQTLLSGMGELHLEIARDRLIGDLKAKAEMGKIFIAYRETITGPLGQPIHKVYEREVGGKRLKAGISATIGSVHEISSLKRAVTENIQLDNHNALTISIIGSATGGVVSHQDIDDVLPTFLLPNITFLESLKSGTIAALSRGPHLGFALHSTHVHLTISLATDIFSPAESTFGALISATRFVVSAALKNAMDEVNSGKNTERVGLMEPVMDVVVSVDESYLGVVVSDISSARGGNVYSLDDEIDTRTDDVRSDGAVVDPNRIYAPPDSSVSPSGAIAEAHNRPRTVRAKVPLKEMVGYLRHLRSMTKGRGTFVMVFDNFERMSGNRAKEVIDEGKL